MRRNQPADAEFGMEEGVGMQQLGEKCTREAGSLLKLRKKQILLLNLQKDMLSCASTWNFSPSDSDLRSKFIKFKVLSV